MMKMEKVNHHQHQHRHSHHSHHSHHRDNHQQNQHHRHSSSSINDQFHGRGSVSHPAQDSYRQLHYDPSECYEHYSEEYKPPFLPLLVLAFPIMPLFWSYHVRIYSRTRKNRTTTAYIECDDDDDSNDDNDSNGIDESLVVNPRTDDGYGDENDTSKAKAKTKANKEDLILSFGYNSSLSSKQIHVNDIAVATPIKHINGLHYAGRGLGYGISSNWFYCETCYIPKNGSGVQIILKHDKEHQQAQNLNVSSKHYVFICNDPYKVCELINDNNHSELQSTPFLPPLEQQQKVVSTSSS